MFPHDQQLLLNATALPQWFKHIWVGERHKYWMTSTTKTLKKQKQTQKRFRLLRKINFLNENNTGSNTDLQKFCSFPFRKRRSGTYWCSTAHAEGVVFWVWGAGATHKHNASIVPLTPTRGRFYFRLQSFRCYFQILKNYKTVHSKWIKETSGSESSENVLTRRENHKCFI